MLDEMKNDVIVMVAGSRIRGCFSFVLSLTELRVSTRLHQQTMLVKRLRFCFQTVCIWEQCLFSFCFVFCPDRGKRCTGGAVTGCCHTISGQGFFVPRKESKDANDSLHFWRSADHQSGCRLRGIRPALCPWGFLAESSGWH